MIALIRCWNFVPNYETIEQLNVLNPGFPDGSGAEERSRQDEQLYGARRLREISPAARQNIAPVQRQVPRCRRDNYTRGTMFFI